MAELQQKRQAVSFRCFALQLRDLEFQVSVSGGNLLVFPRSILQPEVFAPRVAKPPEARGACTFKWRDCANSPDANKPPLRLALDLHGQHEYLQQDDSGEQDQRFVARGNGYHVKSEIRNSKLENRNVKLVSSPQVPFNAPSCAPDKKQSLNQYKLGAAD